jgi:outer membrane immunogenic protein
MKRALLAAASLAAVSVAPAAAQWSGFYIGAQAGYGWTDVDMAFSNGAPSGTNNVDGVLVGGHLGWQHQTPGGWVFGIEGDGEWSNADGGFVDLSGITSEGFVELDWQASARARLGFASGSWLAYVTGGGAFGGFDVAWGPAGGPFDVFSTTEIGWTVGGGLEFMVAPHFSLGAEYRYTDFGNETDEHASFPGVFLDMNSQQHAVRGRGTLHF